MGGKTRESRRGKKKVKLASNILGMLACIALITYLVILLIPRRESPTLCIGAFGCVPLNLIYGENFDK